MKAQEQREPSPPPLPSHAETIHQHEGLQLERSGITLPPRLKTVVTEPIGPDLASFLMVVCLHGRITLTVSILLCCFAAPVYLRSAWPSSLFISEKNGTFRLFTLPTGSPATTSLTVMAQFLGSSHISPERFRSCLTTDLFCGLLRFCVWNRMSLGRTSRTSFLQWFNQVDDTDLKKHKLQISLNGFSLRHKDNHPDNLTTS